MVTMLFPSIARIESNCILFPVDLSNRTVYNLCGGVCPKRGKEKILSSLFIFMDLACSEKFPPMNSTLVIVSLVQQATALGASTMELFLSLCTFVQLFLCLPRNLARLLCSNSFWLFHLFLLINFGFSNSLQIHPPRFTFCIRIRFYLCSAFLLHIVVECSQHCLRQSAIFEANCCYFR